MKYFDDVTYEEMSEILETSVGALKSSYHFAVKKIESYFAQQVI
jgi:RNA polymerase sigma-70 factor (ECF subfamily)